MRPLRELSGAAVGAINDYVRLPTDLVSVHDIGADTVRIVAAELDLVGHSRCARALDAVVNWDLEEAEYPELRRDK